MLTPSINFSARNPHNHVSYHSFNKEKNIKTELTSKAHFLAQTIEKEVIHLNKKEQKKAVRILQTTLTTCVSLLALVDPVFAATSPEVIMPKDIMEIMKYLTMICLGISVGLATLLLIMAGIYRMFRREKEAKAWTTDILKGLTQSLIAMPLVMLIVFLVSRLFSNSEWFISPF